MRIFRKRLILLKNERAQALLEFVMMLPMVLAFFWYTLKVNVAINKSIVAQKHLRSQLFLKLLNHRDYPVQDEYLSSPGSRSVYYMGVSETVTTEVASFSPAPIVSLGIGKNPRPIQGTRDEAGEAESDWLRQNVRIRNAFGICTSRKPQANNTLGSFCGEVNP